MAFRIKATYPDVEYRGYQSGFSEKSQRDWLTLIFEDDECDQIQASVPANMQNDVREMHLSKGDHCAISILAVATNSGNSYVQLTALPELLEEDEQGMGF